MSLKVSNIIRKLIFTGSLLGAVSAQAQQDSLSCRSNNCSNRASKAACNCRVTA